MGFKILVRAGRSSFMYGFLLYTGKTETSVPDKYNHL